MILISAEWMPPFLLTIFPKCDIRRGFRYALTEEIVLFPQVDFKAFK